MPIDFEALFGGDTYDPCAALRALRPAYMALLTGGVEQTVKFRDRETTWSKTDLTAFGALIKQLEADCPAANPSGTPRRFAITAGTRRDRGGPFGVGSC
jgi:hypothetical protein